MCNKAPGRGGARPRVGRYLDGRLHLVDKLVAPSPALPRSKLQGRGWVASPPDGSQPHGYCQMWCGCAPPPAPLHHVERGKGLAPLWSPRGAGGQSGVRIVRVVGGGVLVGKRVSLGAGIGRDAGQAFLAQPGLAGRQGDGGISPRHADGADPAPRPEWPGVRQHPVPSGRHADGQATPRLQGGVGSL